MVHVRSAQGVEDSVVTDDHGNAIFPSARAGFYAVWCDTVHLQGMDGEQIVRGGGITVHPGAKTCDTLAVLDSFSGLFR